MAQFKKYHSIENRFHTPFIDQMIAMGFDQDQFVVQEKVHGANLSFWCDGSSIKVAKRTGFIKAGEGFYNYQIVLKQYEDQIYQLFRLIKKNDPQTEMITLFGELFGGVYPHDDVERNRTAIVVQKGIYYTPDNNFYAFDIMVNQEYYLGVDRCNELFDQLNFFYAKTLFRGTLSDVLNYGNQFQTTLPEAFNLPPLEHNICEGVVIKPVEPRFLNGGSRVMIKDKNDRWSENQGKHRLPQDEISEMGHYLAEVILDYINQNRLNNVLSKLSMEEQQKFGILMQYFNHDILDSFLKDYKCDFDALERSEQKRVKKVMNQRASEIIQNYFKGIST